MQPRDTTLWHEPSLQLDLLLLRWNFPPREACRPVLSTHQGWCYVIVQERPLKFICLAQGGGEQKHSTLTLDEGEVLIIDPHCVCHWTEAGRHRTRRFGWIWRTPPSWPELKPEPGGFLHFPLGKTALQEVERLHLLSRREVRDLDRLTPAALECLHRWLDLCLGRAMRTRSSPAAPRQRMELALQWMKGNVMAQNPVSTLCEYLQISRLTLNRMFRRYTRQSAIAHFQGLRMRRAGALLRGGKTSVKEIALNLGYRHPNDFSRAYKTYTGRNPSTARRRVSCTVAHN